MVESVSAASLSQAYSATGRGMSLTAQSSPAEIKDVVAISVEAVRKYQADQAQDTTADDSPSWELPSGTTHAERTLRNGHTEIIDIDGGTLTVREYDGDRLVKSVDGTMVDGRAVLDTNYYDENGRVSQAIHAELARLETKEGWSGAVMNRSVQWFEDGKVVRTLGDQTYLRTRNVGSAAMSPSGEAWSRMTGNLDADTDTLVRSLTSESHNLSYHADIQEFYDNGRLSRNMVIDQGGEFGQVSNRHGIEVDGMGPLATREVFHDTRLAVTTQEYDRDGNLLREASVSDAQEDGTGGKDGRQVQTADIAWYKDGEVVKRGNGTFRLEETEARGLMKRPGILDLLGLKAEEYLTSDPLEADGLLGAKLPESSGAAEFFMEGLGRAVSKGWYGSAADMARYGHRDHPFSVNWTTELYEEGEVVMRKSDSQKAVSAPDRGIDDRLPFRTVGGLSDGDRPVVLERSGHTTEIFDNGKTVVMESLETREVIQPDESGPDTLLTLADYDRLDEDGRDGVNVVYRGGIDEADPDVRAGLRAFGAEFDLTMDAVYDTYRNLRTGRGRASAESGFRFATDD